MEAIGPCSGMRPFCVITLTTSISPLRHLSNKQRPGLVEPTDPFPPMIECLNAAKEKLLSIDFTEAGKKTQPDRLHIWNSSCLLKY